VVKNAIQDGSCIISTKKFSFNAWQNEKRMI
jgi:hypothetical protein